MMYTEQLSYDMSAPALTHSSLLLRYTSDRSRAGCSAVLAGCDVISVQLRRLCGSVAAQTRRHLSRRLMVASLRW